MNQLVMNQSTALVEDRKWTEIEEFSKQLLRDGKYLSFENAKNDYHFLTFFIYGNDYRKKDLSEGTLNLYKKDLKHFLEYLYSLSPPVRLSEIGYLELKGYQNEIVENYASATARRKLQMIKSLLSFGFKVKFYPEEMSHYIRIPSLKRTRQERKLTRDEMNRIFEVVRRKPMNRVICSFLLMMGLRISELCNANWGDIYEGISGRLMMRVNGKGDKERNLKVRHDVFSLLLQYRAANNLSINIGKNPDEPLIVNSKGNRLLDRGVRFMVRRAAKRAGVEKDISPHWFRHSAISFALDDGATIAQVQKMAGHADIRTTQVYLHELDDEKGKSASEFISGIEI